MEKTLASQLAEAAAVLLCGMGLGFVYQVLSCVRARRGRLASVICDVSFCLLAAASLFLMGMGPGGGELRLYMPAAAAGGAAMYFLLFGSAARPMLGRGLDTLEKILAAAAPPLGYIRKILASGLKNLKNIFSRARKRFTITLSKKTPQQKAAEYAEDSENEAQKSKYLY